MSSLVNSIVVGIKGFMMGAANVIPGVSGGTIALITGIYDKLIGSLNALMSVKTWKLLFKKDFKGFWGAINGAFLVYLSIGVLISIFSLAKVMEYCLSYYPIQTWAFFFGLILASSALMLRDVKEWKGKDVITTIAGVVLGLVICTLSPTTTPDSLWFIAICGAISICTMILPGISGSFVLVILGKYDYIMSAVSDFNITVLAVFGIGCAIGIMAFAKFLHWLLERYERSTMLVLIGFVLGSLIKVWPWSDKLTLSAAQTLRTGMPSVELDLMLPSAVIMCLLGLGLVACIEMFNKKMKTK